MVYRKIQVDVQIDCRENMLHTLQAYTGYEERVLCMMPKSRLRQSADGIHKCTLNKKRFRGKTKLGRKPGQDIPCIRMKGCTP